MHETNRQHWDATAAMWKALRDADGLWREVARKPDLAFEGGALELIRAYAGDLNGKRACVIGSGDNYAAFALAGLGARVTSSDISSQQLRVAAERAEALGLDIEFVQADAAGLEPLASAQFDLVVSTNGLFVWIAEPLEVFTAICRVLRPGGSYVTYDIHPFQRPWKDQALPLEMQKPYAQTGPFYDQEGDLGAYEFNWRLSDLLNPLLESGLLLRKVLESPAKDSRFWVGPSYVAARDHSLLDWRHNPRAGLPVWLTIGAQKPLPGAER